jgi:hypothetical protein
MHTSESARADGQPRLVSGQPDDQEALFWTLMHRFEARALACYRRNAPPLATAAKADVVRAAATAATAEDQLAASELARPVEALFACVADEQRTSTLLVQGLVLEYLGQSIYRIGAAAERISPATRALAAAGLAASEEVTGLALDCIATEIGTGEPAYAVFADVTHDALGALDALSEPVDRVFGERFGLRFADLLGEFTADLIGACTRLEMPRRKVVAHLAGACMGL